MRAFLYLLMTVVVSGIARADLHPSAEALIESLQKYDFAADREGLGHLLSIEEPRQPELAAKIVSPVAVEEAQILWKSDQHALAWITSRPATQSTPSETGALMLLSYSGTGWFIASKLRFEATGTYADIRFEFTGGDHSPPPIVTITTSNGGRGASYRASATFEFHAGRIIRKDL